MVNMTFKEYFKNFMKLPSGWDKDRRGGFTMSFDDASFISNYPLKDGEIERLREIIYAKYRIDRIVFILTFFLLIFVGFFLCFSETLNQFEIIRNEIGVVVTSYCICSVLISFAVSSLIVGYLFPVSIEVDGVNYVSQSWDLRYIDILSEIPSEALDKSKMTEGARRFFDNVSCQGRPFVSFEAQLLYESYIGVRQGRKDVFSE